VVGVFFVVLVDLFAEEGNGVAETRSRKSEAQPKLARLFKIQKIIFLRQNDLAFEVLKQIFD
jgi:hypothetical protein